MVAGNARSWVIRRGPVEVNACRGGRSRSPRRLASPRSGRQGPPAGGAVGPSVRKLRAYVKTNPPLRAALFLAQNAWHAARSLTAEPLVRDDGTEPRHTLVAMVRVKDEARFLPEWMAHQDRKSTRLNCSHV